MVGFVSAWSLWSVSRLPVEISLIGKDPEGDAVSFVVLTLPRSGRLVLGGRTEVSQTPFTLPVEPRLAYLPQPDAHGRATFTYAATDGQLTSDPARVTIHTELAGGSFGRRAQPDSGLFWVRQGQAVLGSASDEPARAALADQLRHLG